MRLGSGVHWRLDYLFDLARHSWLVHLAIVGLLGGAWLHSQPDQWAPRLWLSVMVPASLGMWGIALQYTARRMQLPEAVAARYGWVHTALTCVIGLAWGLGALGIVSAGFELLLVYSLALGGTALGAVSSQHVLLRSCYTSLWTSLPLLAVAHYQYSPAWWYGGINAVMVVLYGLVLSVLSYRMARFLALNVELSASLDAKVGELTVVTRQLEAAQRQATEASLAKSRFLVQASHDLRQPIHAIGLLVATLRDTPLAAQQRELVAAVGHSVEMVSGLFQSLLDISRLDVGGVKPEPGPVALQPLLRQVAEQLQPRILARMVMERENSGALPEVRLRLAQAWTWTDATLLAVIVQNLLSNALKYGNGRVLVGLRREQGTLAIQVSDQGPGIEASQLEHIFDEFFRVDDTRFQRIEGLGLGLAIVRRLADLLGLRIRVQSRPGKGATFKLSGLPVYQPEPADQPAMERHESWQAPLTTRRSAGLAVDDEVERGRLDATPKAPRQGGEAAPADRPGLFTDTIADPWREQRSPGLKQALTGYRVCLIDDDAQVLAAGAALLRGWGCDVLAVAQCPSQPWGCQAIISDYELQAGEDGVTAIRALRQMEGWEMPAIIVMGCHDDSTRDRLEQAGLPSLHKPVAPAALHAWLMRQAQSAMALRDEAR